MAIKRLLTLIGKVNIAEDLDEQRLMGIGRDVIEGYDADWASMSEWRDDVDTGLELIKPANGPQDSKPWQGAANFKTPLLTEARIKFGDRASEELLGTDQLVKAVIMGKDPDDEKADRVERVEAVMNWQLTVENDSWLEEQDKLLYNLSDQGHIFKKTFFDPSLGHNDSVVIMYPNFAINQSTKTLDTALRFTHKIFKTPNQIVEMVNAGVWLDMGVTVKEDENQEAPKIEVGATVDDVKQTEEAPDDNLTEFYEQQTFIDLDDDGYEEPYLVTIHAASGHVMRIKAQYALDDIFVRDDKGLTSTVDRLLAKENGDFVFDDNDEITLIDNDKPRTVIKITREKNLVSYGFLNNPQAEFLSVGYFHILGAYAQTINTTTNQLLDSGTLANMQGGFLAKGFRKKLGDMKFKLGAWMATDISAQDLQSGMLPHQFKEPSATLLALNTQMTGDAQRLSSTTDLGAALGPNTPATTTLSIVQDQQQAVDAVILRIYRAMGREFGIWFRLNAKFMDPEQYKALLDEDANPFEDFNTQDMDIMPAANPRNSSKIQRLQRAQVEMSVFDQIGQTGGNLQEVIKSFLKAAGSENVDDIYPELTPEQQQAAQAKQEENEQLEKQLRFLPVKAQADIGEAEKLKAQVNLLDAQTKRDKQLKDNELTDAKIDNTDADTGLKVEQTQTENTKNDGAVVDVEIAIDQNDREREQFNLDRGQANEQRTDTGVV